VVQLALCLSVDEPIVTFTLGGPDPKSLDDTHHPAAIRGHQHRRRPALPRPAAPPAPADDHELL